MNVADLSSGGNDPAIICDDVNVEEVAPKVSLISTEVGRAMLTIGLLDCHVRIFELGPGKVFPRSLFQQEINATCRPLDLHCCQTDLRPRVHLSSIPRRIGQVHQNAESWRRQ